MLLEPLPEQRSQFLASAVGVVLLPDQLCAPGRDGGLDRGIGTELDLKDLGVGTQRAAARPDGREPVLDLLEVRAREFPERVDDELGQPLEVVRLTDAVVLHLEEDVPYAVGYRFQLTPVTALDLHELRNATEQAYLAWQTLARQLQELEAADADRASRLDLLAFQLGELDALDLQPDEMETLQSERQKLQNSGRLADGVSGILQNIYDNDTANAQSILAEACQTLDALSAFDVQLEPVLAMLQEASIQVSEAADSLQRYADTIDMDPMRRDWVEERLSAIQTVARKHRVEADALGEVHARVRENLSDLQNAEERGAELAEQAGKAGSTYQKSATVLSRARRKAAASFSAAVTETMAGLGMPGGVFEASITDCGEGKEKSHGVDLIE